MREIEQRSDVENERHASVAHDGRAGHARHRVEQPGEGLDHRLRLAEKIIHDKAGLVPGIARPTVTTAAYRRDDEHFITAAFTGAGQAVQMSVTAWPVRGGNEPTGAPVLTTVLH